VSAPDLEITPPGRLRSDSIESTLGKVTAAGGAVATPLTPLPSAGEAFATVADPAGNIVGLYQQPQS
jgi:predicted enzyme related to lactoylglutathione lyase